VIEVALAVHSWLSNHFPFVHYVSWTAFNDVGVLLCTLIPQLVPDVC